MNNCLARGDTLVTIIPTPDHKEFIQMVDLEGECLWPSQQFVCHYQHAMSPHPFKPLKQ